MSRRINVMIDDDTWGFLGRVPAGERSRTINEALRALVPSLWLYEVGNTVSRRFPEHAAQWLAAPMKFGLAEAPPSDRWVTATLDLIARYGGTFYDATYHAVAFFNGGVFVTSDRQYIERTGDNDAIMSLAHWQPPEAHPKRRGC